MDPDLSDELRVTVVATGLGQEEAAVAPMPTEAKVVVDNTPQVKPERVNPMDHPAAVSSDMSNAVKKPAADMDYDSIMDIPTFLRRQAD